MMKEFIFTSGMKDILNMFIQQKRAFGHVYHTSGYALKYFDTMLSEQFPDANTVTKEICKAWIDHNSHLHPNTQIHYMDPIRELTKYMAGLGYEVYIIPNNVLGNFIKYEAHIFTEEEIKAFFAAVDSWKKSDTCKNTPHDLKWLVAPVIFRLLYTSGLRQQEVRMIKCSDVNLKTGRIRICESKGWKERIIFVRDDMLELLCRYDKKIKDIYPNREYFFVNSKGNRIGRTTLGTWFHLFWDNLPVAKQVKGNPPRIHDFRHTFAVHKINEWVKNGENVEALMPYLSEYMGHTYFFSTDYYLQLSEDFYPEFNKRMHEVNKKIISEVSENED